MCVKLILPPRARRRWLLMTTRLSAMSLAGTARTLVAVGTVKEASMLATTRAAAPRSGLGAGGAVSSRSAFAGVDWAGFDWAAVDWAGFDWAGFGSAGWAAGAGVGCASGLGWAG